MNRYFLFLKKNWEWSVLAGSLAVSAIVWVVFLAGGSELSAVVEGNRSNPKYQGILSAEAFRFLGDAGNKELKINPFAAPLKAPAAHRPKPEPPPRAPKIDTPAVPVPAVQPPAETTVPPTEETIPEKKPNLPGRLTFTYQGQNAAGKAVAIIKVERTGTKSDLVTLSTGESAYGFRLLGVSGDEIMVQDASGRRGTLPIGEARTLWLSPDK